MKHRFRPDVALVLLLVLLGACAKGPPMGVERVDSQTNRYAVSARSMLLGERRAHQVGLDVVGYFHSHPDAPAVPSEYDLDHATWPGVSYPIVSIRDAVAAELRSWTLADDRSTFVEEIVSSK